MPTAAFRSTSRRSAGGSGAEDASSSNRGGAHRRSRSLSCYSGRFPPPPPPESDEFSTPRGRFVNKVRGSGFPEISLDDLADEFFRARAESESEEDGRLVARRSSRRNPVASYRMETESSRGRGRSVSRPPDRRAVDGKPTTGGSLRRLRSVSVARRRCSDTENDVDLCNNTITRTKWRSIGNGSSQQPSLQSPAHTGHALRRSISQKNFFQSHDSYSSHSSSLTDDEAREVHSSKSGTEKTIWAVHAQEKLEHPTWDEEGTGLYEVMRKEVRHAVEEIRTELAKVMTKTEPTTIVSDNEKQAKSSNVIQVIADIRRNYTTKLEQSEKRMQELLAELAVEEQRGQELTKIVAELLPSPKQTAVPERPSRSRRRSNERTRMSKHLTEEAERFFEDFLSNVEDTDLSSFDGERSDTSSMIRDLIVPETPANLTKAAPLPVEADGVVLPWLQWETSNDTPSPCKTETEVLVASGNILPPSLQEASAGFDSGKDISSSLGSWSPEGNQGSSVISEDKKGDGLGDAVNHPSSSDGGAEGSKFDMDEYLALQHNEDLLFERQRQRQRIDSGSLILCGRTIL